MMRKGYTSAGRSGSLPSPVAMVLSCGLFHTGDYYEWFQQRFYLAVRLPLHPFC